MGWNMDRLLIKAPKTGGRVRFLVSLLLSSPAVAFVHAPLLVAQTIAGIAIPFATGRFIDALVSGSPAVHPFLTLAALSVASAAVAAFLQRFILRHARRIELKLQNEVLESAMDFAPHELSALSGGELVAKLTRDAFAVGGFVSGFYPRLLAAVVTMFASGFALRSRSTALCIAFVAFIPLAVALFLPFARRFSENSRTVRTRSDQSYITLFDFFRTLPFLRTLDAERRFADSPRGALRALNGGNGATDSISVAFGALLGAILVVGQVAVLGVAGTFAARGSIPVGDVVVYQMLFMTAMQSVQAIVTLLPESATLREAVDSLREALVHPKARKGGHKTGKIESVEFRNVTFAYSGGEPVIKDFSAVFRAGRAVALVGSNGAGKTTLLKLAVGALEPQSGEVLVNGIPMSDIDIGDFRRRIGVVFQDSLVVSGSVRDNVTLRDPAVSAASVENAASASGLDEVAHKLSTGFDTRVGTGGQSLSGGECQRLAIARALVRDPNLLVLDEATNHLDAVSRAAFGRLLRKLMPGRIVLVVTHDDAVADLCDEKIFCQIPE